MPQCQPCPLTSTCTHLLDASVDTSVQHLLPGDIFLFLAMPSTIVGICFPVYTLRLSGFNISSYLCNLQTHCSPLILFWILHNTMHFRLEQNQKLTHSRCILNDSTTFDGYQAKFLIRTRFPKKKKCNLHLFIE